MWSGKKGDVIGFINKLFGDEIYKKDDVYTIQQNNVRTSKRYNEFTIV